MTVFHQTDVKEARTRPAPRPDSAIDSRPYLVKKPSQQSALRKMVRILKRPVTVLLLLRRLDSNDGVASYCETLVKGLNAQGDRVVIISGSVTHLYGSTPRFDAISSGVVEWIVVPGLRSKFPKIADIRRILSAIKQHSIDVISPQGLSILPVAFLLSKISRCPVVANYHPSMGGNTVSNVATEYSLKTKLAYRGLVTLFRPDRVIAISKEAAEFFHAGCGVPSDRIALINNGIDTVAYRPPTAEEKEKARQRFSIPENALVCELSGRLNLNKGHDIVADAIRILRKTRPELNVICLFSGGGDQAEDIKSYVFKDEADAKSFQFLGFTDFVTLRDMYWAADIGLLPSRFEGFGISMIEAMSCGCVPIRTPGGGWREQITDGVSGFIVPFNDPQALADRIAELSDPMKRQAMREKAIAHVASQFSQDVTVAKTSDLYRDIVSQRAVAA
jgi:glycosyltransferase involved in cell wall biosynthesis